MNSLGRCFSRRSSRAVLLGMAMSAAFAIDAGTARAEIHSSYSVTLDAGTPDVTDILIFETYPPYAYASTYSFQATADATSVFVNPFNLRGPSAQSLLMGIVNGLPSDGDLPVDHLVLFLNPAVATTILDNNLSFSSLFPGTDEASLINTFEFVVRTASGSDDWYAAYNTLTSFLFGVENMTITTGDGTTTANGLFAGPTTSTPAEATGIAFSDPQKIGTATVSLLGAAPVPEPSSLALLAVGTLGCFGAFWRRSRTRDIG